MKQHDETCAESVNELLRRFEEASTTYLTSKERLAVLCQRLDKHHRTAEAARADAGAADQAWRQQLRSNDGEIEKKVRSLKQRATDSRELAEELQAMAGEVETECELCRLELHSQREAYLSLRNEAALAYAAQRREETAAAMFSTSEGQAFFAELARTGFFKKPETEGRPGALPANNQRAVNLMAEIKRLMSVSGFEAEQAADTNDTWESLRVEQLESFEELSDARLRNSVAARYAKRAELQALQHTATT